MVDGQVGANVSLASADAVDTSAAPSHAPSTSSILAEVARAYPTPDPSGYYPVYTDTPRGGAQYCAWHSYGTVNGKAYIFAFFFKLDGDPGCDPQSSVSKESQGLAALANVSAHELSESRTDPDAASGWFDSSGAENGDKCAWTFNVPSVNLGGTFWKLQGEWSNAAYNSGTGGYAEQQRPEGLPRRPLSPPASCQRLLHLWVRQALTRLRAIRASASCPG